MHKEIIIPYFVSKNGKYWALKVEADIWFR